MKSWHLLRVEDPETYLLFNLLINYKMVLINILPLYPAVLFMLLPIVSLSSQPSPRVSLGDSSWNPSEWTLGVTGAFPVIWHLLGPKSHLETLGQVGPVAQPLVSPLASASSPEALLPARVCQ